MRHAQASRKTGAETSVRRLTIASIAVLSTCASVSHAGGAAASATARRILAATGVRGGLVVHLGCGNGRLTTALRAGASYLVHGLDADPANVQRARSHIRALGLCGKVSVRRWASRRLPYADSLVNLLVADDLGRVPAGETLRVLVPGGVAYVGGTRTVKPRPEAIDEWTHWLHAADGNAVAGDTTVGPPRHLQWTSGPLWSRHHDTVPSVSAMVSSGGRLFCIADEAPAGIDGRLPDRWSLVARDAFNGVLLWKRPMPEWGWRQWSATWHGRFNQPTQLPKRLVAAGGTVYVTLKFNAPVTALEAATGEELRTYEGTAFTDEILYHEGRLVLSVNREARRPTKAGRDPVRKSVCVVEAESGRMLWKKGDYRGLRSKANSAEPFGRLELAAGDGRVFLVDHDAIVSVDLESGAELWRASRPDAPEYVALFAQRMNDLCVLVYHSNIVLFAQPEMQIRDPWHSIPGTLYAYSAEAGELLWKRRYAGWSHFYQPDVFVIGGLVWIHEHQEAQEGDGKALKKHKLVPSMRELDYAAVGLDPATGEVRKRFSTRETFNVGHHHRCHRNNATERFLVTSRRGVEFLDLEKGENRLHHWARGGCLFGVVPANGLLYLTPHPCDCYIATKLNGFFALAPEGPGGPARPDTPTDGLFERGPAYDRAAGAAEATEGSGRRSSKGAKEAAHIPTDWPTYRHDPRRSGSTPAPVPTDLRRLWQAEIGGRTSPVVAAGGRAFATSIDEHRVIALDAATGKPVWTFTAGGRVDTPPTIHHDPDGQGLALFGSADGWVYCLRASDGRLVWRRRAAPAERLVGAFGQLESAWPVHGSVLVEGGLAYLAAGRSSYLDGGVRVLALDPATGDVRRERTIYSPDPETGRMPPGDAKRLPGVLADILVSGGSSIHMRQMKVFEGGGRPGRDRGADRTTRPGAHVFSTAGFRDESWFNRTRWAVGAASHAQLLVFDEEFAWGVKAYQSTRRTNFFLPGTEGYLLFSAGLARQAGRGRRDRRAKPKMRWSKHVPVRFTAMVLADETLFAGGAPDLVDPDDPLGAFEGRKGGVLSAFAASDGKELARYELDAPPAWDGMAAADGRLYISTRDGRLVCMGGDD